MRLRGSVGQADLAPLAELAVGLLDRGRFELEAGEGLALIDNSSFSTALAGLALADALQLAAWLETAAALDMEGFRANPALLHAVLRERSYAGLQATAERLRLLLSGSALHEPGTPRNLQDPLTYRNIPQLHGALRDALAFATGQLAIELNAADSNPLVDVDEERVVSVACFEILPLAAALDFVRIALAPVLTSANERSMKLLHAGFSGLPAGLADEPGSGDDGYTEFGVAGQALVAEARLLAAPVSYEMASSSQAEGIEDRMTMAPLAARRLAEMLDLGRALAAVELVAARAIDLGPQRALGAGTQALYRFVRAHIPTTGRGEAVPADLAPLAEALRTNASSVAAAPRSEPPATASPMQHAPKER
jgi:histidine ammonia-lyase